MEKKKEKEYVRKLFWIGHIITSIGLAIILYILIKNKNVIGISYVGEMSDSENLVVVYSYYNVFWYIAGNLWLIYKMYRRNFEIRHLMTCTVLITIELLILFLLFYFFKIMIMPGLLFFVIPYLYLYIVRIRDKTGRYKEDFEDREHMKLPERKKID